MRLVLSRAGIVAISAACAAAAAVPACALERVNLQNGATWDCVRVEPVDGGRVRVYVSEQSWSEIPAREIVSIDQMPDAVAVAPKVVTVAVPVPVMANGRVEPAALNGMLTDAGKQHDIDADLLASVVMAESGGQARAVSRTGAQGLMQLMPGTARELSVKDSFEPQQNIAGGTQYLDEMLTRYHDDIPKAVAAYNAGPAAVDKYHGVPPYRETRAYVARVVGEFNRRKRAAAKANADGARQASLAKATADSAASKANIATPALVDVAEAR